MIKLSFVAVISVAATLFQTSCAPSQKTVQPMVSVPVTSVLQDTTTAVTTNIFDREDDFFENIFKQYPGVFDTILANRKEWNIQIIYTQIDRDKNNLPTLTHHYFNKNNARYFYPASTVKLPVALLALENANLLMMSTGKDMRHSAMVTEAAYSGQTAVYNDPDTKDGRPSIEQYVKKIFLVSDNDAFNRLYELVGQSTINYTLQERKGYKDIQILHRLDVFLTEDENRHTNPVSFFDSVGNPVSKGLPRFNEDKYQQRSDYIGNGYYSNGKLISKPMVFSNKNRIPLNDLHTILQSVIFPETVKKEQRFNITEEDRNLVLRSMSEFPRESLYPSYDSTFSDGYAKAIMYGNDKSSLPKNIRVFDKSGTAYGQLVDVAYVIDTENKIEFMVSAAIYCNSDGILNDDKYDYDSIGYPFMKNLGKALYNHEAKRKKNYLPDLSSFIFTYDK